jgi:glycosyltransferase involved in cell wall biosynthesis
MIGINYHGFFKDTSGISEATRSNALALQSAGVSISFHNYYHERRGIKKDTEIHNYNTLETNFNINLFQINLNELTNFFEINSNNILKNKYNIAYWAWEFKEIPEEIFPFLSIFDEIWVPSNFCVEAFANVAPIPVLRFLHPIQSNATNSFSKNDLGLPTDSFNFLTIFDSISTTERKNPFGAIDAFTKAFSLNNSTVKLIIKTFNLERNEELMKKLNQTILNSENIILINENYDKAKMESLIQNCDGLISLHRSEGFGLTMAEAMSYGKPVVATGYSGNIDYMNCNNSFLVKYDFTELKDDCGILKKGFIMSEPDLNHASELLKFIVSNRNDAEKIGARAQQDCNLNLSIETIGSQMKTRLEVISKNFIGSSESNEKNEYQNALLENSILKEKVKYLENTLYSKIRKKINAFFKKNK